jgi:hypothetical protein
LTSSCRHRRAGGPWVAVAIVVAVVDAAAGSGCRGDRPSPGPVTPTGGPLEVATDAAGGATTDLGADGWFAPDGPLASDVPPTPDATPPDQPEPPAWPDGPFALPVDGFEPAVAVPAVQSFPPASPLIVILHGNFDRPEWQCATWRSVGSRNGWLLCPRGTPRTDVDPALDRWTWADPAAAGRETAAAVAALRGAVDGAAAGDADQAFRVDDDHAVLVGFSLGARYAPAVAAAETGVRFVALVLVEQGFAVTTAEAQAAAAAGVARVIYACGERTECGTRAEAARGRWKRAGVAVEILVMEGVGHAYPDDFDPLAERVFELLAAS